MLCNVKDTIDVALEVFVILACHIQLSEHMLQLLAYLYQLLVLQFHDLIRQPHGYIHRILSPIPQSHVDESFRASVIPFPIALNHNQVRTFPKRHADRLGNLDARSASAVLPSSLEMPS